MPDERKTRLANLERKVAHRRNSPGSSENVADLDAAIQALKTELEGGTQ